MHIKIELLMKKLILLGACEGFLKTHNYKTERERGGGGGERERGGGKRERETERQRDREMSDIL